MAWVVAFFLYIKALYKENIHLIPVVSNDTNTSLSVIDTVYIWIDPPSPSCVLFAFFIIMVVVFTPLLRKCYFFENTKGKIGIWKHSGETMSSVLTLVPFNYRGFCSVEEKVSGCVIWKFEAACCEAMTVKQYGEAVAQGLKLSSEMLALCLLFLLFSEHNCLQLPSLFQLNQSNRL